MEHRPSPEQVKIFERITELSEELKLLKEQIGFKICPLGHLINENNITSQGRCRICLRQSIAKYAKSEKGKAARNKMKDNKNYVARVLGIAPEYLTDELYLLKRDSLKLKRQMENKNDY